MLLALNTSYSDLYEVYAANKPIIDEISFHIVQLSKMTNDFINDKSEEFTAILFPYTILITCIFVDESLPIVQSQVSNIWWYISKASLIVETMGNVTFPVLIQEAEVISSIINNTTAAVNDANNLLHDANSTAVEAINLFKEKSSILGDIEYLSNNMTEELSEANSYLNNVMKKLEEAESAAASVR